MIHCAWRDELPAILVQEIFDYVDDLLPGYHIATTDNHFGNLFKNRIRIIQTVGAFELQLVEFKSGNGAFN